jgi:cytochrome subunit of sulfide dehydrogenase
MTKPIQLAMLALATLAVSLPAVAQTPAPASGRTLAATCSGCHGPAGRSAGEIPSIYGRTESQIAQAMLDFKNDRRPATMMNRHAKGFSDAEIAAIAKEISANWR